MLPLCAVRDIIYLTFSLFWHFIIIIKTESRDKVKINIGRNKNPSVLLCVLYNEKLKGRKDMYRWLYIWFWWFFFFSWKFHVFRWFSFLLYNFSTWIDAGETIQSWMYKSNMKYIELRCESINDSKPLDISLVYHFSALVASSTVFSRM